MVISVLREKNIPITEERMKCLVIIYQKVPSNMGVNCDFLKLMTRDTAFVKAFCDNYEKTNITFQLPNALINLEQNGIYSDLQMILFIKMVREHVLIFPQENGRDMDALDELRYLFWDLEGTKTLDEDEIIDYVCSQRDLEDRRLLRLLLAILSYAGKERSEILDILNLAMSKGFKDRLNFIKDTVDALASDIIVAATVNNNDDFMKKVSNYNSGVDEYIEIRLHEISNSLTLSRIQTSKLLY